MKRPGFDGDLDDVTYGVWSGWWAYLSRWAVDVDEELLLSFEQLEHEHWWFVVRRRIVLDALAEHLPPVVTDVLEVGCGTGGMLSELRTMLPDADVRGVEPCAEAAAIAGRTGCEIAVAAFESLPAADESTDVVLALDVLEHCDDDGAAAHEAWRVLRPEGILLATVPALPSLWGPHDDANEHKRRYVADTIRAPIEAAGLEVERLTYFNSLLLPAAWVTRRVSRLTGSRGTTGVKMPARPVNATLQRVFSAEVAMLKRSDLRIGLSLLAVAKRPA